MVRFRPVPEKLTLIAWLSGIVIEVAILARGLTQKMAPQYPFFFAYLSCVFLSSASGLVVERLRPGWYAHWYWGWEFVCVIAGYSVVLEIIEKGLAPHLAGAKKLFRNLAMLVFSAIVGYMVIQWMWVRHASAWRTSAYVEMNLRTAEAFLLAAIIAAIGYYGISVGKNLKGIIVGYTWCVAIIVIVDSVQSHLGKSFQDLFSSLRSTSYLIALLIWVIALWSYQPVPFVAPPTQPRKDYEVLTATTKEAMDSARTQLEKAARR